MKQTIIILLIILVSCTEKKKETETVASEVENQISETKSTSLHNDSEVFSDKNESFISISKEAENIKTTIENVNYSIEYLSQNHELNNYVVKKTQLTNTYDGQEGQFSKIKIEIFNIPDSKKVDSFEIEADDISIFTDFYQTVKYGCCGAENYYELKSLWKNESFLKYNSKYYDIEFPNSRMNFYFGFLSDSRNEEEMILGELYFAHAIPKKVPDKRFILTEFKTVNRIIFKVKNREHFDRIVPFSPEMTLVENNEEDHLVNYPDHQELRLRSFDNWESLEGISFLGLKMKFQNDTIIPVDIPIVNGFLFGKENNFDKVIYL